MGKETNTYMHKQKVGTALGTFPQIMLLVAGQTCDATTPVAIH